MWAQVRGLKEWSAARYVLLGEDVRADKVGDAFCLVTPHPQVRPHPHPQSCGVSKKPCLQSQS